MKRYIAYLKYVLVHKWFVMLECWKRGLYRLGIIRDFSKFLPSEFVPYAKYFYTEKGKTVKRRDATGYYKPSDTGQKDFDFSWLLHQKRNKHHWQWWILPQDDGKEKIFNMPLKYKIEMICDWYGAGRAQKSTSVKEWYDKNKNKMRLHPDTRKWVEDNI